MKDNGLKGEIIMDTRIQKSISKFELKKEKKLLEKEKIEEELNEIEANLKQLYSLQEKQNKLQSAIDQYYQPKEDFE